MSLCLISSTHDSSTTYSFKKTAPMMVQVYRDRPSAGTASEDVLSHVLAKKKHRNRTSIPRNITTCCRTLAASWPDTGIGADSMKNNIQDQPSETSPSVGHQETSRLPGPCRQSRNARQCHRRFIQSRVQTLRLQTWRRNRRRGTILEFVVQFIKVMFTCCFCKTRCQLEFTSFSKVRNLFASFRLKLFTTPIN